MEEQANDGIDAMSCQQEEIKSEDRQEEESWQMVSARSIRQVWGVRMKSDEKKRVCLSGMTRVWAVDVGTPSS